MSGKTTSSLLPIDIIKVSSMPEQSQLCQIFLSNSRTQNYTHCSIIRSRSDGISARVKLNAVDVREVSFERLYTIPCSHIPHEYFLIAALKLTNRHDYYITLNKINQGFLSDKFASNIIFYGSIIAIIVWRKCIRI